LKTNLQTPKTQIMKAFLTTGLFLLFAFTLSTVTAQERENPPVTLEKISEHVYLVEGGRGSTGGAIITGQGVLLIDAKMDEKSVKQTFEAVSDITSAPVNFLVNTHSDGDHIMGNRYLPSSVTIIAHENCRDDFFKANFGRESDWDQPEFYPFTPSITFSKNLDLWLGKEKVELHYFGVGHTTGDIIVYFPAEKTAFLGDLYFEGRPQLIHSGKNGNSFAYVKTMSSMLETLDAETFLSGHSEPVSRAEIKEHIQGMVERQKKVKTMAGEGKELDEVLAAFQENESRLVTSIYNEITSLN
jgi:glyoxylase-like metal-dependent hydrolase (beta-lactamase superfamily II)